MRMGCTVIAYGNMGENSETDDLKKLLKYVKGIGPKRIFIAMGESTEKIINEVSEKNPMIPVLNLECTLVSSIQSEISSEMQIKKKVLDLGLETISKYVETNSKDMASLNSEITYSLYRAFFLFYSAAMKKEYEFLFEERRMCIYGKLTDSNAGEGDTLITTPWDAYWFYDRLN